MVCYVIMSNHIVFNGRLEAAVNYQTITPKDLAKSVLSEGGWSKIVVL